MEILGSPLLNETLMDTLWIRLFRSCYIGLISMPQSYILCLTKKCNKTQHVTLNVDSSCNQLFLTAFDKTRNCDRHGQSPFFFIFMIVSLSHLFQAIKNVFHLVSSASIDLWVWSASAFCFIPNCSCQTDSQL